MQGSFSLLRSTNTKKEDLTAQCRIGRLMWVIFDREVRSLYRLFAVSRHPLAYGQTCFPHPKCMAYKSRGAFRFSSLSP